MSRPVRASRKHMMPWSAALLAPVILAGCGQPNTAAPKPAERGAATTQPVAKQTTAAMPAATQPAVKPPVAAQPATQPVPAATQVMGKGSWYLSTNTTPSNWSKTGLYYQKPWEDHVDVGDNTTLELYVKALTPHTIEVFNAKKLSIGLLARPDATHTKNSAGVSLGDYVQLTDQNWTKVSIPLADFKDVNLHEVFFFPALPQALGTGDYSLGVDEIRFVGGKAPVVWYGDEHPNNPIDIHGPGMKAYFIPTGGVDVEAARKGNR